MVNAFLPQVKTVETDGYNAHLVSEMETFPRRESYNQPSEDANPEVGGPCRRPPGHLTEDHQMKPSRRTSGRGFRATILTALIAFLAG